MSDKNQKEKTTLDEYIWYTEEFWDAHKEVQGFKRHGSLDLYTADEVASIHLSKKQIEWKIKYGNYDEAMECIKTANAYNKAFSALGFAASAGETFYNSRKIFEVWNDESEPFYRKITETIEKGSFAGEGISHLVQNARSFANKTPFKALDKVAGVLKISGGTFSSVNAIDDIIKAKKPNEYAASISNLVAGGLDISGGICEFLPKTGSAAIILGIMSTAFTEAGKHFKNGEYLTGAFVIIIGGVFSVGVHFVMKGVLKVATKALMAFIKSAFQITLSPLLANIITTILALAVAVLIEKLLSAALPFAQGGFPLANQPFIAREAGPELVGSLNGRNAVVNNTQIVESVSRGVYTAFLSSFFNQEESVNVEVFLDGRLLVTSQCT